jgi:antitoxin YefM
MSSINITNARKNLYKIVKDLNDSHEPIHITGKSGAAVLIAEDDWKAIEETLYITSIPGIRESIIKGMSEPIEKCSDKLNW